MVVGRIGGRVVVVVPSLLPLMVLRFSSSPSVVVAVVSMFESYVGSLLCGRSFL